MLMPRVAHDDGPLPEFRRKAKSRPRLVLEGDSQVQADVRAAAFSQPQIAADQLPGLFGFDPGPYAKARKQVFV